MSAVSQPVLSVRHLAVEVRGPAGPVRVVEDVSFDVAANEVLGLVGESGSGKSLTMLAVMGLLPAAQARVVAGDVTLGGANLRGLSAEALRRLRGGAVAMIFQDPMTALNPVLRIGRQIGEAIRIHHPDLPDRAVRTRVVDLLDSVGVPNPERRIGQYPHEFSGGMRQRAMIAMAIANDPALLIADEPTTALDVTIQAQVLEVLARARRRTGAGMVLITHDLGLVEQHADRVAVMYGGRLMETGPGNAVFGSARHPYTVGLMASRPQVDGDVGALYAIEGQPPGLADRPAACAFAPRCGLRRGREPCTTVRPELRAVAPTHLAACHYAEEVAAYAAEVDRDVRDGRRPAPAAPGVPARAKRLLVVQDLTKHFPVRRKGRFRADILRAVERVSLSLAAGETLGIVGESGCGKSTLGRVILDLQSRTSGAVYLDEHSLGGLGARAMRPHRRKMQVVFQDPYASLDPRMSVHDIVAEPMRINRIYRAERVAELLAVVGLGPETGDRRPSQFSGGQRQRIAIARALALDPKLIILDEAVSALDVSIQAQIVNMLQELQRRLGLSYLFISHDLAVVRHISQRVAVMYLGRIVETGPRDIIFEAPSHPYTQALLSAAPGAAVRRRSARGELPDPLAPPSGCAFRTRCNLARPDCAASEPALLDRLGDGRLSACHFATEALGDWRAAPAPGIAAAVR